MVELPVKGLNIIMNLIFIKIVEIFIDLYLLGTMFIFLNSKCNNITEYSGVLKHENEDWNITSQQQCLKKQCSLQFDIPSTSSASILVQLFAGGNYISNTTIGMKTILNITFIIITYLHFYKKVQSKVIFVCLSDSMSFSR